MLVVSLDVLDDKSKKVLKELKITTVFDLIETDSGKLARLCFEGKLSSVNGLKSELIKQHCPSVKVVSELLCRNFVKTNIHSLDKILGGKGIQSQKVYEIYGPPGAGKTQLAMFLALLCSESINSALYIDTKNNFSLDRLQQMARERLGVGHNPPKKAKRSEEDQEIAVRNVLGRCQVSKAFSLHQILDVICSIKNPPRFVVIDSIASVIVPLFGSSEVSFSDISATLSLLISKIRQLTIQHKSSVLLVNNAVVNSVDGKLKPALGKFLTDVADIRLQMRRSKTNIIISEDNNSNIECALEMGSAGFIEK